MYDIRDVLQKGIEIALKKKKLFEKLEEENGDIRVRMVLKVLISAVDTDVRHYQSMIQNITTEMAEDIDFGTYDKISSLVTQFSVRLVAPVLRDRQQIVDYSIGLEKAVYALLVDIKGRLVSSDLISNSISYYVLLEMIDDKEKFIKELESFNHHA